MVRDLMVKERVGLQSSYYPKNYCKLCLSRIQDYDPQAVRPECYRTLLLLYCKYCTSTVRSLNPFLSRWGGPAVWAAVGVERTVLGRGFMIFHLWPYFTFSVFTVIILFVAPAACCAAYHQHLAYESTRYKPGWFVPLGSAHYMHV
jgi:hypothetical protein